MYTQVPKMVPSSDMALYVHLWTIGAKGQKSNDETVPVYSL